MSSTSMTPEEFKAKLKCVFQDVELFFNVCRDSKKPAACPTAGDTIGACPVRDFTTKFDANPDSFPHTFVYERLGELSDEVRSGLLRDLAMSTTMLTVSKEEAVQNWIKTYEPYLSEEAARKVAEEVPLRMHSPLNFLLQLVYNTVDKEERCNRNHNCAIIRMYARSKFEENQKATDSDQCVRAESDSEANASEQKHSGSAEPVSSPESPSSTERDKATDDASEVASTGSAEAPHDSPKGSDSSDTDAAPEATDEGLENMEKLNVDDAPPPSSAEATSSPTQKDE